MNAIIFFILSGIFAGFILGYMVHEFASRQTLIKYHKLIKEFLDESKTLREGVLQNLKLMVDIYNTTFTKTKEEPK